MRVPGARTDADGGAVYFVDVITKKASLIERLFPGLRDGSTLVPAHAFNPEGLSAAELRREGLRQMRESQRVAAAVALEALGYDGLVVPLGVRVEAVARGAPAARVLRAGDLITKVGGKRVRGLCGPQNLRTLLGRGGPAGPVTLTRVRDGRARTVTTRTVRAGGRTILGIDGRAAARIRKLPVAVRIDAGRVGGPSAGLAFALEVLEKLGRDVDHGLKVAATGTIEADGCVGAIGGVKQKTIGAREAGVDAFLVPADGENAAEARRYAHGLRIIPVKNFRQALSALTAAARK